MGAAAKCASRRNDGGQIVPTQPPALIVDGRQTTAGDVETKLSGDSVQAVYILCWNPADSTFYTSHGGTGFNVIWVVSGMTVDRVIAELQRTAARGLAKADALAPASGGEPGAPTAAADPVLVERTADGARLVATLQQGSMIVRCVLNVGTPAPATASAAPRDCTFTVADEKFALRTEG
jgi:hypothetical protein